MRAVILFVVIAILAVSAFAQDSAGGQLPAQGGQVSGSGDQKCAPNGTPCNYKGIGGFTNCCTKFCLQFPEESMGRCANPEGPNP